MRNVVLSVLATLVLLLAGSGPASAHAALVGSDPADGATVATVPESVSLDFNEPIGTTDVAVTAPDGSQVDVSGVEAMDRTVTARVADTSQRGTYTVAYRVVSVDGHPVAGTFTFEATEGDVVEQADAPVEQASFVHRHSSHLLWAGGAAVVAVALVVVPLVRRRAS